MTPFHSSFVLAQKPRQLRVFLHPNRAIDDVFRLQDIKLSKNWFYVVPDSPDECRRSPSKLSSAHGNAAPAFVDQ